MHFGCEGFQVQPRIQQWTLVAPSSYVDDSVTDAIDSTASKETITRIYFIIPLSVFPSAPRKPHTDNDARQARKEDYEKLLSTVPHCTRSINPKGTHGTLWEHRSIAWDWHG